MPISYLPLPPPPRWGEGVEEKCSKICKKNVSKNIPISYPLPPPQKNWILKDFG